MEGAIIVVAASDGQMSVHELLCPFKTYDPLLQISKHVANTTCNYKAPNP